MKALLITISLVVLISCDIGEIPLEPITSEREIYTIPMGSNYMTQTYYNLENNQIVSQNNRIDWDVAFESKRDSNYIYLNSSKFVQVWLISEIPFDEPINLEQALWQWDQTCLVNSGTAIDNLSQEDVYYVIDLGLDENLEGSGFIKFKVINGGKKNQQKRLFIHSNICCRSSGSRCNSLAYDRSNESRCFSESISKHRS